MAWTNITNAQLAIGAPIRSIDLLALRDNFAAMANGDVDAPRITDPAIGNVIAGTNYVPVQGSSTTSSTSNVKALEFRVMRGGSLTIRFDVRAGNVTGYYRIYKNGVAFTAESAISPLNTYNTITITGLSFNTNDLLQIYARTTDSDIGTVAFIKIKTGVASNTTLFSLSDSTI